MTRCAVSGMTRRCHEEKQRTAARQFRSPPHSVPRANVRWTRPKPLQWTLSRHSVRPTAKQTGIFACCHSTPLRALLAFRSARRLPARLLNYTVDR